VLALLKLFRFPLVFTAVADSAAGYALFGGWARAPWALGLLAIASSGLYFFGMALNDIADRERDRTLAPGRVLPSGRLSLRRAVCAAGGVLGISLGAVIALPGPLLGFAHFRSGAWAPLVVWGLLAGAIALYDCVLKLPPVMGAVRALNFLLGAMAAARVPAGMTDVGDLRAAWILALSPLLYVTSLTFVSTFEEAPARRRIVLAGASLMAAAGFLPEILSWLLGAGRAALGAWIVSAALGGLVLWRAWAARDRPGILLLVRDGVGGIILLDAITLLSVNRRIEGGILLGLLVPAAGSVALFRKFP
jgi:4-hydroxybenzoate polyprenyltransferase